MNKKDLLLSNNWEEIISYINQERQTGLKLRDICRGVISKDRMSQRIKENGYTYSPKLKIYVKNSEKPFLEEEKDLAYELTSEKKKTLKTSKSVQKSNSVEDAIKNINQLLKKIEDLEQRVSGLENKTNEKDSSFKLLHFNEKLIAKTFKLYPSAVEAIEQLNRQYSGFKKQDLLSSLIIQAVTQYIE